ncbi:MAG: nucleotidyltransferase [Sedimentisphaerales bacterium]|nr:nucleotidyltransferase [Sedimentisphaerales bacterium]
MSEELEVLKIVTKRLEETGIDYMISGSIAANYYTIPRMTRDIDIVIELKKENIDKFASLFEDDFYINKETVINEVSHEGMFNVIFNQYVIKIDFIVKKSSEYQQGALSRRKQVLIGQSPMWFISAEDLIISKLIWSKDSYSEMQLQDVRNLMETVENLDLKYIENWIHKLDLERIYKEVTQ